VQIGWRGVAGWGTRTPRPPRTDSLPAAGADLMGNVAIHRAEVTRLVFFR